MNLELDVTLPEEEDTIAGFLLSKVERIPHAGEKFQFSASGKKNVEFVIERATARRIVSIILGIKD